MQQLIDNDKCYQSKVEPVSNDVQSFKMLSDINQAEKSSEQSSTSTEVKPKISKRAKNLAICNHFHGYSQNLIFS